MEPCILEKPLFGATVTIVAYGVDPVLGTAVLEQAYQEGLRLQAIFNAFDRRSELSRLNQKRRMQVSDELREVVAYALALCAQTGGQYDITLGKNMMERKAGTPLSRVGCSYRDVAIEGREISLHHPDVMIDLGSIAKGYIADTMVEKLKAAGVEEGYIDARGDIRFFGSHTHTLAIQHPREAGSMLSISVQNAAIATSGDYLQFHKSFKTSHLLQQKELISVTVVGATLREADAYATALFVSDPQTRVALLKQVSIQALLVSDTMEQTMCNGFAELVSMR